MSDSSIQILGIVAGIFTSASLIPQVVKVYREKKAEQISIGFVIILLIGQSLWVTYGALKSDIPVVATNIFAVLISIIMIVLGIKYRPEKK